MRIQNTAAVLLTGTNEFLSPRQMAELLNYTPEQIFQIKRRLSNYCSENHFSGYPTLEQASEIEKKQFFYSTVYRAENHQIYPCYSGAIFKHHYGDKAQSLSASFIVTFLFLKNDILYTPDDVYRCMSSLQLLGEYGDSTESRSISNVGALFFDFLDTPKAIYGFHLKEVIDTPRFKTWVNKLITIQPGTPSFLIPIAYRLCGHLLIGLQRSQARELALLKASFPALEISKHQKAPKLDEPSTVSIFPLVKFPRFLNRKPTILIAGAVSVLVLSLALFFKSEEPKPLIDSSFVAIAILADPPI